MRRYIGLVALVACSSAPVSTFGPGTASQDAGAVGASDAGSEASFEGNPGHPGDAGVPVGSEAGSGGGGGAGDAAADAPALDCTPHVVHDNGIGGSWTDCQPLGTYTVDEAMAACASAVGSDNCEAGGDACRGLTAGSVIADSVCAKTGGRYGDCWVWSVPTVRPEAQPGQVTNAACLTAGTWK
jgi:hypothetical protein